MIIRVWRGRTPIADAAEYERFLREMAYPDYGEVPATRNGRSTTQRIGLPSLSCQKEWSTIRSWTFKRVGEAAMRGDAGV